MSASVWALEPEELVHHMVERQEYSPNNWMFTLHEILDASAFVQMIVTLWAILGSMVESDLRGYLPVTAFCKRFYH